jgi:hypothetical protein
MDAYDFVTFGSVPPVYFPKGIHSESGTSELNEELRRLNDQYMKYHRFSEALPDGRKRDIMERMIDRITQHLIRVETQIEQRVRAARTANRNLGDTKENARTNRGRGLCINGGRIRIRGNFYKRV